MKRLLHPRCRQVVLQARSPRTLTASRRYRRKPRIMSPLPRKAQLILWCHSPTSPRNWILALPRSVHLPLAQNTLRRTYAAPKPTTNQQRSVRRPPSPNLPLRRFARRKCRPSSRLHSAIAPSPLLRLASEPAQPPVHVKYRSRNYRSQNLLRKTYIQSRLLQKFLQYRVT